MTIKASPLVAAGLINYHAVASRGKDHVTQSVAHVLLTGLGLHVGVLTAIHSCIGWTYSIPM